MDHTLAISDGTVVPIVDELKSLLEVGERTYSCLRGPRPSAARLYTPVGSNIYEGYMVYKGYVAGHVMPPAGSPSCKELGECMMEDGHCVRNNHAEVDALIWAAKLRMNPSGGIMLSINKPCYQCTRALIAADVAKVYYIYVVYDEERTRLITEAAGLEMIHVPIDVQ